MKFNPCGRGVQFLEDTVTDYIRPFRDSDIQVKRRWYRVPEGTPLLGVPSAFTSNHYNFQKWLKTGPGEVFGAPIKYTQNDCPPGLTFDHVCGSAEDFLLGAVFDPTAHVEYDDEWIPLCCGRESVCTTQLCATDPVHGVSAAQLWSYPLAHQETDDNTPVHLLQRAFNQGDGTPSKPGLLTAWFPAGVAAAAGFTDEHVANASGVPTFREVTFRRTPTNAVTERYDADGYTLSVQDGAVSGSLTFRVNGAVAELCGVNATICPALLPATVFVRGQSTITAAGTTQATATPVTTPVTSIAPGAPGAGVLLPSWPGGVVYLKWQGPFTDSIKVYPDSGSRLNGATANVPITLNVPAHDRAMWLCVRSDTVNSTFTEPQWSVVLVDEETATGTVTSVDIGTSSAGLTVGGGPITGAGTLTVDLGPNLESLAGASATNALYYRNGSGAWAPVAVDAPLSFAGGTLDVAIPTTSFGRVTHAGFAITAATNVYQATGSPITLPAAGSYMVIASIRGDMQVSTAGTTMISAKLVNTTTGVDLVDSEVRPVFVMSINLLHSDYATAVGFVTTSGACNVEIYAKRVGAGFVQSDIGSNANGRTTLCYVKLA